jgi:hypothetical protein
MPPENFDEVKRLHSLFYEPTKDVIDRLCILAYTFHQANSVVKLFETLTTCPSPELNSLIEFTDKTTGIMDHNEEYSAKEGTLQSPSWQRKLEGTRKTFQLSPSHPKIIEIYLVSFEMQEEYKNDGSNLNIRKESSSCLLPDKHGQVLKAISTLYSQFTNWLLDVEHLDIQINVQLAGLAHPPEHSIPNTIFMSFPSSHTLTNDSKELTVESLKLNNSSPYFVLTKDIPAPYMEAWSSLNSKISQHGVQGMSKYNNVALGGSFDHLHAGHKVLLSYAAILARQKITCGIVIDSLLHKKECFEAMEPYATRCKHVSDFISRFNPTLSIEVCLVNNKLRTISSCFGIYVYSRSLLRLDCSITRCIWSSCNRSQLGRNCCNC